MQFVDAREAQERMQQQIRRRLGVLYVRVHLVRLRRVPGGRKGGRELWVPGDALFGPARVGMNTNRWGMLDVKIRLRLGDAVVVHKLLWPKGVATRHSGGEGLLAAVLELAPWANRAIARRASESGKTR
jgi:hypothetical protein